jgi:hypothetical protein
MLKYRPPTQKREKIRLYLKARNPKQNMQKLFSQLIIGKKISRINSGMFNKGWIHVSSFVSTLDEIYNTYKISDKINLGLTKVILSKGDIIKAEDGYYILAGPNNWVPIEISSTDLEKGWSSESFKSAVAQGVVQRDKSGRFASTGTSEVKPVVTQEIKPKQPKMNAKEKKVYDKYVQARSLKSSLDKQMNDLLQKESYGSYSDKELSVSREKIEKLKPRIENLNAAVEVFVQNTPQGSDIRKIRKKIDMHQTKSEGFESEKEGLMDEYREIIQAYDKSDISSKSGKELYQQLIDKSDEVEKISKKKEYQDKQVNASHRKQDAIMRGLAHPFQGVADKIYAIEKKIGKTDRKHKKLVAEKAHAEKYYNWAKENIDRKDPKGFYKNTYDMRVRMLEVANHNLEEFENKKTFENLEKQRGEIAELAKQTTLRKYDYWGYIEEDTYKGARKTHMNKVLNTTEIRQLFREEFNYAIDRLGIDLNEHPELLNIKLQVTKDMKSSWLGFSNSYTQKIALRPGNTGIEIQETIRHEFAHHFADWNMERDYYKAKKFLDEFTEMKIEEFNQSSSEERGRLNKEYQNYRNIIFNRDQKRWDNKNRGRGEWSQGHGKYWQQTMHVLFGSYPTYKYHGGVNFREEET